MRESLPELSSEREGDTGAIFGPFGGGGRGRGALREPQGERVRGYAFTPHPLPSPIGRGSSTGLGGGLLVALEDAAQLEERAMLDDPDSAL